MPEPGRFFSGFLHTARNKLEGRGMMKISHYLVYLKPAENHTCPLCQEKLERRQRPLWQRLISFAVPFRHYQCSGCYKQFLAISSSWKKVPAVERALRILVTAAAFLLAVLVFFKILIMIFTSIMA